MIGRSLAGLVAAALVAVGGGALLAPRFTSSQYGIRADDPRAVALIRAMGIRDVAIGCLVVLMRGTSDATLAAAMLAGALVAATDLALVTAQGAGRACAVHAAGGLALVVTAGLLLAGR